MEIEYLLEAISEHRKTYEETTIGYTSGVFDLLHAGHISYLERCRARCDILVIGVDSDAMVKKRKGASRPKNNIVRRLSDVEHISIYCFEKKNRFA